MKVIIDTLNFTLYYSNIQYILSNFIVENWEQNRAPDIIRIKEMREKYIISPKEIIPGIIYAYRVGNKLIIIDGIHRFEAFKSINTQLSLIIQVYKENVSKEYLLNEFIDINSSVPLPELYKNIEEKHEKASFCEEVVRKLIEKWPKHVSPSRFNQPQNFNRDNIIDMLSNLDINFKIDNVDKVFNLLMTLNEQSRKDVESMCIQVPRKCYQNNCFLFYKSFETIKNYIKNNLHEKPLIIL